MFGYFKVGSTVLMPITINEYMICTYMLIYELHENDGKKHTKQETQRQCNSTTEMWKT